MATRPATLCREWNSDSHRSRVAISCGETCCEVAKAVKDSELQATVLAAKDRELAEAEVSLAFK